MPTAAFIFGPLSQHHAKLVFGVLGSEKYFVNGRLVHSHWSLMPSGTREFSAEGHRIQIRVSISLRAAQGEAWVDGKLVESALFATFNDQLARRRLARGSGRRRLSLWQWLLRVAVWFVVSLALFSAYKALAFGL